MRADSVWGSGNEHLNSDKLGRKEEQRIVNVLQQMYNMQPRYWHLMDSVRVTVCATSRHGVGSPTTVQSGQLMDTQPTDWARGAGPGANVGPWIHVVLCVSQS